MDRIVVDQASSQPASIYESVQVPFSEAELDEFEREEGGRTLAEIMADLECQHRHV